jgi:hypothetical protein
MVFAEEGTQAFVPKENIMPVLPSGRRVEFSLDRFRALLGRLDLNLAFIVTDALRDPDDLLVVMDAVHFSLDGGKPYFADYVAADWETRAGDWSHSDRAALRTWLDSEAACFCREDAIDGIKALLLNATREQMYRPDNAFRQISGSEIYA